MVPAPSPQCGLQWANTDRVWEVTAVLESGLVWFTTRHVARLQSSESVPPPPAKNLRRKTGQRENSLVPTLVLTITLGQLHGTCICAHVLVHFWKEYHPLSIFCLFILYSMIRAREELIFLFKTKGKSRHPLVQGEGQADNGWQVDFTLVAASRSVAFWIFAQSWICLSFQVLRNLTKALTWTCWLWGWMMQWEQRSAEMKLSETLSEKSGTWLPWKKWKLHSSSRLHGTLPDSQFLL